MVDYMFRMAPERVRLKELLDGHEIGRIIRVTVEWTGPGARRRKQCLVVAV